MKIAVIGAGNMGGAMVRGWARSGRLQGVEIAVANPSEGKLKALAAEIPGLVTATDNRAAAAGADIVVIAVKPWIVPSVIEELRGFMVGKIVISVAAGIEPEELSAMLGSDCTPVFYAIPNTPVSVNAGMIFCCHTAAGESDIRTVEGLLGLLGSCMMVEKRQMQAGMAVASCGIAYAMRYIRAAEQGGVELGLRPAEARKAVMQTLKGAVALLEAGASHPEEEIDRVTTPGGITIRGLNAMEEAGFSAAVVKGLRASK